MELKFIAVSNELKSGDVTIKLIANVEDVREKEKQEDLTW